MLEDHPGGIGLNMFSYEFGRYYSFLVGEWDDSVAPHIYWMTAAEVGDVGLFAYVLLLAVPMIRALRASRRARSPADRDLAFGCLAGMALMNIQGVLEPVGRQTIQMYLFWIVAVLAAALLQQGLPKDHSVGQIVPSRV
jgi:hypothetical protein